jgi:predicted HTH transcriptional regulator
MSLSTVKRKIKDLKEQGIIKRIGSDKRGYWKIIEK